ncbi:universal stress protein [Haloferax sp. MBLA0076]|uniref:Universal stress protein n=1 Tax=Haloferax litoreum TaxID=2666140 RepID=A0A6A8GLA6_9EURY|nr:MULTISPECIES: universal stress protein [Haloferax]KAB1190590.1 universal stress protein [Haloferax sp. CBA1148]MRX23581.1 universal stress protein [Haloferax litoreum]
MYDQILVPIDGGGGAEGAIGRALDFARIEDATVHVLHVVDTSPEPPTLTSVDRTEVRQYSEKRGRDATQRVATQATNHGIETVRTVAEGIPHRAILDYSRENDIDLVVMGTHGETGRSESGLGSTTQRVVTFSDVPVLAVRLDTETELSRDGYTMYNHVVVPTDGSDAAMRAAEHGLEIAERYGAHVHVVYVVDTTTYGFQDAPRSIVGLLKRGGERAVNELAAEARDRNLPVTTDVLRGVPEDEILAYATGVDTDVITMGTRGRSAGTERFLGSTTARLVARAEMAVLTTT